uniref:Glutamyl-tRNA(Gln) amidotransferase subunit B, mitochondrial n=1 Tax=Panagrolaimus sp. PS1159 TaxID=55785 RepID=A0AC35F279_9BILA
MLNKKIIKFCSKRFVNTQATVIKSNVKIEAIIGLEIHTQLLTKSKLFSFAPVQSDAASNSVVSNFDLGVPGTLPSLNKECVQKSLCASLLLKSEIQKVCRFDRKHYFYPDMPLGYQITQQDYPIARGGYFSYYVNDSNNGFKTKKVYLKQIQLEMDSGKTIKADENTLYIDLNRAGVGLIEIVTEPNFHSGADAATFVDQLKMLFVQNRICAGELHKGNMRIDANISLCVDGFNYPRTEIKNISSIRLMEKSIEKEIKRQTKLLNEGKEVEPVTLHLDETGQAIVARSKGDDLDYRFTPEPNLPRLQIEVAWIKEAESKLNNSLAFEYYVQHYRMQPSDAIELVKDQEKFDFVKNTLLKMDISSESYFKFLKELEHACGHIGIRFPPNSNDFHDVFVQLLNALTSKLITKLIFIDLMKRYLQNEIKITVEEVVEKENLKRLDINDQKFMKLFDEICMKNPKVVEKLKSTTGKPQQKAFTKLRNIIVTEANKLVSVEDAEAAIIQHFEVKI